MRGGRRIGTAELRALRRAIEPGWDDRTAWRGRWTAARPSLNQCAITAMLIQDLYGGDLVATTMDGVPHFYNRLPGGQEIDLTRDQFRRDAVAGRCEVRTRASLDANTDTVRRYRLLRDRVGGAAAAVELHWRPAHELDRGVA